MTVTPNIAHFSGHMALSIWMMVNIGPTGQPHIKENPTDPSLRTAWTNYTGTCTKKPVVLFLTHRKASEIIHNKLYDCVNFSMKTFDVIKICILFFFLTTKTQVFLIGIVVKIKLSSFFQVVNYHRSDFFLITRACYDPKIKALMHSHSFHSVMRRLFCYI